MVGDDTEGDGLLECIGLFDSFTGIDVGVGLTAERFECTKDRLEDVGRVVGGLLRKVGEALGVLDERTGAFKAHASVDVLGG